MRVNLDHSKKWNHTKNAASLLASLIVSINAAGIKRTALVSAKTFKIIGLNNFMELMKTSLANGSLIALILKTILSDLRDKEMEIWFLSDLLDERKRIESVHSFARLLPLMALSSNPTLSILRNQEEILEIGIRNTRIKVEVFDIDRLADANIDIPFSESWPIFRNSVTKGKGFRDHILKVNPDSSFVPVIRGFLGLANDLGIRSFRFSSYSARARKDELVAVCDFSDAGIALDVRKIPPFSEAPLSRYLGPPLSIAVKTLKAMGACKEEGSRADAMNSGITTGLDMMPVLSSMPMAMEKIYQRTGFNMCIRISDIISVNTSHGNRKGGR